MDFLLDWLSDFSEWLGDKLLWVPRKLTELVLDGLALLIEAIPVPTWLANAGNYLAGIDPTIAFFLQGFRFAEGLTIIFAAYILRFLIRRIPLIG